MNQKSNIQYGLLPYEIIKNATQGDVDAIDEILKHYEGYIDILSKRRMYDEYGQVHYCAKLPLFC